MTAIDHDFDWRLVWILMADNPHLRLWLAKLLYLADKLNSTTISQKLIT